MIASALAAPGDCTKFINASGNTTACVGGNAGIGNFTGAVYGITLNTGQGDYELYGMNQNVLTSSNVSFKGLDLDYLTFLTPTGNNNYWIHMQPAGWIPQGRIGFVGSDGGEFIMSYNWNDQNSTVDDATAYATIIKNSGGTLYFKVSPSAGANPREGMRMTASGLTVNGTLNTNGAITATAPAGFSGNLLTLTGDTDVGDDDYLGLVGSDMSLYFKSAGASHDTRQSTIRWLNSSDATHYQILMAPGSYMSMEANLEDYLLFETNNTERLRIREGGGLLTTNNGPNQAVYVSQDSVLADYTGGLEIYSNTAQTNSNSALLRYRQDSASSTGRGAYFIQDGTGTNLYVETNGNAAGVYIVQSSAGGIPLSVINAGTSIGLSVDQNDNGIAIYVDSSGSNVEMAKFYDAGTKIKAANKPSVQIYDNRNTTDSNEWSALLLVQGASSSNQTAPLISTYNYVASNQKGIYIDQNGVGDALMIDANGNGLALNIDSEATTSSAVQLYADVMTSGTPLSVRAEAATFSGNVAALRAGSPTNTGIGLLVQQFSTGSGRGVQIEEQGTGRALFIDDNGNGTAFEIDSENTGINGDHAMKVDTAMTVGNAIYFYTNAVRTSGNSLVLIQDDNAASAGDSLKIVNDGGVGGAGSALDITQNGNSTAIFITANELYAQGGATAFHAWVENARLSQGFRVISDDEKEQTDILGARSADTNLFWRNLAAADSGGAVVYINQANASDDQPSLKIAGTGSGHGISTTYTGTGKTASFVHTGPGPAVLISTTAGTQASYGLQVELLNATGSAVAFSTKASGTSSNWFSAPSNTTTQGSNWFWRDDAAASTVGPVVFIEQDNAADDQAALSIQQDGSGSGIDIYSYNAATPSGYGLYVQTASAIPAEFQQRLGGADTQFFRVGQFNSTYDNRFYRNLASGSTAGPVLTVYNDHASDDQRALLIVQDAANNGLYIDQNGDTSGLDGTVNGAGMIGGDNTGNPGRGLYIYSNEGVTSSQELVKFRADNAAYDQPVLGIDNDGVGKDIDFGDGQGIKSNSTCTIINGATSTWNIC